MKGYFSKKNTEILDFKSINNNAEVIEKEITFSLYFNKVNIEYVIDLLTNALIDFKIDKTIFEQEKNAVIEELNEINSKELLFIKNMIQHLYLFFSITKPELIHLNNCI